MAVGLSTKKLVTVMKRADAVADEKIRKTSYFNNLYERKYKIKRMAKLTESPSLVVADVLNKSRNVPTPKGRRNAERMKDILLNIDDFCCFLCK